MPGLVVAFFALVGLGGGSALLGPPRVWDGVDPRTHSGGKSVSHYTPYAWLSTTHDAFAVNGKCNITVFAANGTPVLFSVAGKVRGPDTGFAVDVQAIEGNRIIVAYEFGTPDGKVIQKGELTMNCWPHMPRQFDEWGNPVDSWGNPE